MIETILAPNPSPMTLEGTNTYLVSSPAGTVVVDPGPAIEEHVDAIEQAAGPVHLILTTHGHSDHDEAVPELARRTGARVLHAADVCGLFEAGESPHELEIAPGMRALPTPGHTADSISYLVDGNLLCGDFVLGRGSSLVTDVAATFRSLDRAERLVAAGIAVRFLPGHGPQIDDPLATLRMYRKHRLERLEEIRRTAARVGPRVEDVCEAVYPDAFGVVKVAAEMVVRAQIEYCNLPSQ